MRVIWTGPKMVFNRRGCSRRGEYWAGRAGGSGKGEAESRKRSGQRLTCSYGISTVGLRTCLEKLCADPPPLAALPPSTPTPGGSANSSGNWRAWGTSARELSWSGE